LCGLPQPAQNQTQNNKAHSPKIYKKRKKLPITTAPTL
jgi:hypothetical protein